LFYPGSGSEVFVLQFAVSHPEYKSIAIDVLLEKYGIAIPYFFCPNQFWAHKNHISVLKAIQILKWKKEQPVLIVFSGKENDYRNPDYFNQIKRLVVDYRIEDCVRFLGFIERNEQLQLMNNSLAVIQPSLFEGWSTSIEDAKAMNQYVIASDIPVHREQLLKNVSFFKPLEPLSLAEVIENLIKRPLVVLRSDYSSRLKGFGQQFIRIAEQIQSLSK
jgi:glycosyltransferase involved in cell wall biosynthesis